MSTTEQIELQEKLNSLLAKAASCRIIGELYEAEAAETLARKIIAKLYNATPNKEDILLVSVPLGEYNRTFGMANERLAATLLSISFGVFNYIEDFGFGPKKMKFYGCSSNVNNVALLFNFTRSNYSLIAKEQYQKHVSDAKLANPSLTIKQLYDKGLILTDGKFYRSFITGALVGLQKLLFDSNEKFLELKAARDKLKSGITIQLKESNKIAKSEDKHAYEKGLEHGNKTNLRPGAERTELKYLQ